MSDKLTLSFRSVTASTVCECSLSCIFRLTEGIAKFIHGLPAARSTVSSKPLTKLVEVSLKSGMFSPQDVSSHRLYIIYGLAVYANGVSEGAGTCVSVVLVFHVLHVPTKCGSTDIRRKDIDSHCSKCPCELVECPFAEAGCKKQHQHCELDEQQHFLLVLKGYSDTRKRLLEMEGKYHYCPKVAEARQGCR